MSVCIWGNWDIDINNLTVSQLNHAGCILHTKQSTSHSVKGWIKSWPRPPLTASARFTQPFRGHGISTNAISIFYKGQSNFQLGLSHGKGIMEDTGEF